MKVLLDTHAFIWLVTDDSRLSPYAKEVFLNNQNKLFLSTVSSFEIAVKYSLGKLQLSEKPHIFIRNRIQANAFTPLPLTIEQSLGVSELPFHHRDPFDRLLVAQAMYEGLSILTADNALSAYPVNCIW